MEKKILLETKKVGEIQGQLKIKDERKSTLYGCSLLHSFIFSYIVAYSTK